MSFEAEAAWAVDLRHLRDEAANVLFQATYGFI